MTIDEALRRAYASRSDYRAAMTDVRAAELSRKAAVAGYFPSLSFNADYGTGGAHPSDATQVYDVRGTLSIPIFHGQQSSRRYSASGCTTANRLASVSTTCGRKSKPMCARRSFNLQSSAEQVNVARSNIDLADQTLDAIAGPLQCGRH